MSVLEKGVYRSLIIQQVGPSSCLFCSAGYEPNSPFVDHKEIAVNDSSHIRVNENMETSASDLSFERQQEVHSSATANLHADSDPILRSRRFRQDIYEIAIAIRD